MQRVRAAVTGGGFQLAMARAREGTAPARSVPLSGTATVTRAWETWPNGEFRQRIAQAERSAEQAQHGYGIRNPRSGAMGRYQLLPNTLLDIGWKDGQGNWTATARQAGASSDAEFLANPSAQEAAFSAYLRRTETLIDRNGALAQRGTVIRGVNGQDIMLIESGMVAAAHRRGAGSLARYIAHRTNTPEAPVAARDRRAFAAVARRLQDFGEVAYASLRPAPRAVAGLEPRSRDL
ncbi:hypothetical protein EJV46_15105 [Roseococcus sp. SYP-B2431]|uniref:hypothetical protein n=1 Tax=Roseococcus sp. SYP-B2431 TaxID=2496640 RepID=UPI001040D0EA|nr:hypothetical protein [Roseococcus sp. SYP-B2431]TCH97456.1 hypothetical protein EJV46_15105 [Roseococcus sp. SYP-B2431]